MKSIKWKGLSKQSKAGHHIQRDSCSKWSSQTDCWRPIHLRTVL